MFISGYANTENVFYCLNSLSYKVAILSYPFPKLHLEDFFFLQLSDFKIELTWPQHENVKNNKQTKNKQTNKKNRFNKQNNNFALFVELVNKQRRNFISLYELGYGTLEFCFGRIHRHLTKGVGKNNRDKDWRMTNSLFYATFSLPSRRKILKSLVEIDWLLEVSFRVAHCSALVSRVRYV